MKSARLCSVILAFAAALVAADPYTGTWKLDPAQTKYKTGAGPKEQTLTISESGSDLHIMVKGTNADGSPVSTHYSVPAAGGAGKVIESAAYDAITNKRIGPRERETSYSKNGKVVYTVHSTVSADGKTLTTHVKGLNVAGQQVDGTQVLIKQ